MAYQEGMGATTEIVIYELVATRNREARTQEALEYFW